MNIWIRITKTGGTSFGGAIENQRLPINTFTVTNKNIERFKSSDKSKDFKFTIIRNPYDKGVSSYKWLTVGKGSERFNKLKSFNGNMSYEDFLKVSVDLRNDCSKYKHKMLDTGVIVPTNDSLVKEGTIEYEYFWAIQHLEGLYDTITTFLPLNEVDMLFKLEDINNGVRIIGEKIGKKINLPHLNKTRNDRSFSDFYNDKVMIPFMELYEKDIINFDYEL